MIDSTAIVASARGCLGVPFVHQGRSSHGLDCLGLLLCVAEKLELTFDGQPASALDVPTYGMRPDVALLKAKLDRYLVEVSLTPTLSREQERRLCPGDIVLLKINGSPQHLAIITDYPMDGELGMIHAYAPAGKVVEHRYDRFWQRMTYAAYSLSRRAGEGRGEGARVSAT